MGRALERAMTWTSSDPYFTRLFFQRALALVFLIAFLNAANQFKPLLGERGLLPVPLYVKGTTFSESPSLFIFTATDRAFTLAAFAGIAVSALALLGITERFGTPIAMLAWFLIWALYISFVNVGQTFYGFGWESILLEAGFYAIFMGSANTQVQSITLWLERWLLFRIMFGAGLIKMRGDSCWRDLTCLNYHYETQPMPNPLSWFFHWGPQWTKSGGVLFNHFSELIVPFLYFLPQPIATIAGLITILFQLTIFASGNLSWLNFLTMVLAIPAIDGALIAKIIPIAPPTLHHPALAHRIAVYALTALVAYLSIKPIQNMISPNQIMNTVYNRWHLVGTYGAFGSITRPRYEVVVEGTDEGVLTQSTKWREYEFKGKPTSTSRMPAQIAPYHLRLDWLMWFASFSEYYQNAWFVNFIAKLLENDRPVLSLLRTNPFPDAPPRYVRALLYEYHFTTPAERTQTGQWWKRTLIRQYFPPVSLSDSRFRDILERQGWLIPEHSH
jgi:hypothetical protein